MAALAKERGIHIFAYGTLCGGLLSEKWLGQPEPRVFETVSVQKVGDEEGMEGVVVVIVAELGWIGELLISDDGGLYRV